MTFEPTSMPDIRMPEEFSRLRELAYNLWWSWTPRARAMFSNISQPLWALYRNPVQLLIDIEPHHWQTLLSDGGSFMSEYRRVIREFDRYMDPEADTPFKKAYPDYKGGPVAYFSTEFGLHESLGIYCGGLGVLSGDHAKAASDLGLPFIGIGLLYRHGYFRQNIDNDGRQHHLFNESDFYRMPLRPVHTASGRNLLIGVEFPGREVKARVWQLMIGRVKLYLLDTDITENDAADRPITSQLYVRGREMRFCQELLLGVGGARILREMKIKPAVWHLNEGHSAFLLFERLRELMKAGRTWDDAMSTIRRDTMFTTHTPVPAGNEAFEMDLVEKYLGPHAKGMGVAMDRLLELGKAYPGGGGQPFNLTALAIRMSSYSNGVSQLHGDVSNDMWRHLFPQAPHDSKPIKAITNGVHVATWLGHDIRELVEESLGHGWQDRCCDPEFWQGVKKIRDDDLWAAHIHQKERLIRLFRHRLVEQFARHGNSPDEMREVERMLDPKVLLIGFARRFATYKRAALIFRDYNRLRAILTNPERPVHILFSGKAHPADQPGQDLVRHIYNIAFHSDLRGHIYFVEDYDIRIARHMVQGVEIWLNTPRRPREASGTSGMKAGMNGALNVSISDGWWPEAANGRNGWTINAGRYFDNEDMQDYEDSTSFYHILENEIVPAFYDHRQKGVPANWVAMMKEAMATIIPEFSAARMLQDYTRDAYMPLAGRK
ncbi:MAG TPA: alpha-glucan family phosphorylase [Kiritimatiellia bacterium]|nr:alpha-glucan family phosphorylase [Kiritimatiellia bacterium]HRZ12490.1 alpha-glucan family phosphorylase [Kiritimatiellia bacterium]HSA17752.1 alpha-glucan family phosphorylase [Kiritimatiellia bacterium]